MLTFINVGEAQNLKVVVYLKAQYQTDLIRLITELCWDLSVVCFRGLLSSFIPRIFQGT